MNGQKLKDGGDHLVARTRHSPYPALNRWPAIYCRLTLRLQNLSVAEVDTAPPGRSGAAQGIPSLSLGAPAVKLAGFVLPGLRFRTCTQDYLLGEEQLQQ